MASPEIHSAGVLPKVAADDFITVNVEGETP
jgi:hypothetical protein